MFDLMQDLIVGKSDGNIEVYAYDDGDDSEPILKFAYVSTVLPLRYPVMIDNGHF